MKRKIYFSFLISILAGPVALGGGTTAARHDDDDDGDEAGYEVWVIDQSNTKDEDANGTLDSGGTLYIYHGDDLSHDLLNNREPGNYRGMICSFITSTEYQRSLVQS